MNTWYARPVFFVKSVESSLGFYMSLLDFSKDWEHYEDPSELLVAQVSRHGLELILQKDVSQSGHGRVFLSLSDKQLQIVLDDIERSQIPVTRKHWGMPIVAIADLDGNELFITADSLK